MKDLLRDKWSHLSKKLENLLQEGADSDSHSSRPQSLQKKFELQVKFDHLDQLKKNLPENHIEKVVAVFKRLNPYFQFGLLMENTDQNFSPVAYFKEGHIQVASGNFHELKMKLPSCESLQVMAAPGKVFFKKLKLSWDAEEKCQAYLIRPTPDFAYILFSPVPKLWMQPEMQALVTELRKIFVS